MFIYPYKYGSRSVKALAKALPAKRIKLKGSRFRGRPDKVVVNWGANEINDREVLSSLLLNHPSVVSRATNKLDFFKTIGSDLTVPWTEDAAQAQEWLRDGMSVVARTMLRAHAGEGIVLVDPGDTLPPAPLYTLYIKKQDEFRVHVFLGTVIDVQRKARKLEVPDEDVNWRIRTHDRGFIYAREGVGSLTYHEQLTTTACDTTQQLGLDFGAVDLIYNQKQDRCYALEVNTAPGLEGTTLDRYTQALQGFSKRDTLTFPSKAERRAFVHLRGSDGPSRDAGAGHLHT